VTQHGEEIILRSIRCFALDLGELERRDVPREAPRGLAVTCLKVRADGNVSNLAILATQSRLVVADRFSAAESREDVVDHLAVDNAAKYTPANGEINIKVSIVEGSVRIAVSDNGVGIAPDLMPRIFDLFMQGQRTTDRSRGGLGIGLAIVRNIVALHGGRITVSSDGPGSGSEFIVQLPAIDTRRQTAHSEQEAATSHRILVVDDNEDAGLLMGELLRSVGHEVQVAIDGARALETIERFTPDVAILDIGLPDMDGYTLATELRQRIGSKLRIVAVTGFGQDHARATEAGIAAHFVKPIGLGSLLAALEGLN
jgi:CheY-like chemotaxis protein